MNDQLKLPIGRVAFSPEFWRNRCHAFLHPRYLDGEHELMAFHFTTEKEMSIIKDANALLAGLHVVEGLANLTMEKHAKGEHVTFGDLANFAATEIPGAIEAAGIADHPWRMAPSKRGGGRKPKDVTANADGE